SPVQGGGLVELDARHHDPLSARDGSHVSLSVLRTVGAEDPRHFELRSLHWPAGSDQAAQKSSKKYWGAVGFDSAGSGCGRRSKGLVVEQTLFVAMRR